MNILNYGRNSFYSNKIIHHGKSLTKNIINRLLSKKLIYILGSQRSGTTLLYMLLSSHPLIKGKNEDEVKFTFPRLNILLHNTKRGKYTCYKLPTKTPELQIIQDQYKHSKILWIIRHPYSVVSSMRSLIMPQTGKNWLITNGYIELKRHSKMFFEINDIDFEKLDEITLGAYIYNYKILAYQKFEEKELNVFLIKFEDLIEDIEKTLRPILKGIGLGWSDSILSHHKKHENKNYVGNNPGSKPVDKSRLNPKLNLSLEEMEKIKRICNVHIQKYYLEN
jgi:hypothetical protein